MLTVDPVLRVLDVFVTGAIFGLVWGGLAYVVWFIRYRKKDIDNKGKSA